MFICFFFPLWNISRIFKLEVILLPNSRIKVIKSYTQNSCSHCCFLLHIHPSTGNNFLLDFCLSFLCSKESKCIFVFPHLFYRKGSILHNLLCILLLFNNVYPKDLSTSVIDILEPCIQLHSIYYFYF